MKKIKTAILISGRGSNMQNLIKACKNPEFPAEITLVISNKKDAKGLEIAANEGIATKFIDHKKFNSRKDFDLEMSKEIENAGCEIICLAGFMRLLSAEFCQKWHDKAINIHPSLLPEFKGADAVGDALKAGAKKTGCTVHYVRHEMDSGPIIEQAAVDVFPTDDKEILAARILEQEHRIYPLALAKICHKNNL
jgi:phosphoribosylglycinamide formyltransferase-1